MNNKRKASKFSNRVRFNWGFHDATREREYGLRTLIETGAQCPKNVSKEFDSAYYEGYKRGAAVVGPRPESSDAAWDDYTREMGWNAERIAKEFETDSFQSYADCTKRKPRK